MEKSRYGFVEPKVIISAVIALIFIVVTLFAVFSIGEIQQEFNPQYSGTFTIDDSSIDQICDTDEYGMTGIIVTLYYNDGTSRTITTSDYSYSGDIVTVDEEVIP